MTRAPAPRWYAAGDWNAFFGLALDNLTQLVILSSLLIGVFKFPADLVLHVMVPGTAVGVLVGNLFYSALARRLMRQTGRDDVTAMPFGIDTPSLFGMLLGNGFIVTALLWGSTVAWIIDRRLSLAAGVLGLASVATLFGIIHSPMPGGAVFWPWSMASPMPFSLAGAYGVAAALLIALDRPRSEPIASIRPR